MKTSTTQSGMALLVSLVLLLLLTIVAITAASQSSLQSRMAANSQQQNIAFQTAESGLQALVTQIEAAEKTGNLNQSFGPTTATLITPDADPDATTTATYTASAALPSNCWNVVPSYSLSVSGSREYSCFNIESTGKSCADSTCKDTDNPARALHLQGHLAKSFN